MWWECEIFLQKFWNAKIMTWNQPCKNLRRREPCEEIGFIFCKHLLECTDHSYWKAALQEFVKKRTMWRNGSHILFIKTAKQIKVVNATFWGFVKRRTMWRNGFHVLFIRTGNAQMMTERQPFEDLWRRGQCEEMGFIFCSLKLQNRLWPKIQPF